MKARHSILINFERKRE